MVHAFSQASVFTWGPQKGAIAEGLGFSTPLVQQKSDYSLLIEKRNESFSI